MKTLFSPSLRKRIMRIPVIKEIINMMKYKNAEFINNNNFLQNKAEKASKNIFLGGPVDDFENVGRLQLITLLRMGLYPYSRVLDVGCGSLRGGYWLIHFLNQSCYYGIEPNKKMLDCGINYFLPQELINLKKPVFNYTANFDFSVFNKNFDFIIARSIWTHASKSQIKTMLDSYIENSVDTSVFLTSYLKSGILGRDTKDAGWIGKSHKSQRSSVVFHNYSWIRNQCIKRKLKIKELNFGVYNFQRWLYISKK